jgi:hypothetical protein
MLNLLVAALSPAAVACGGVYIPAEGAGSELTSDASKIVVAVNEEDAVYTVAPTVAGDAESFAMIIPVPGVPEPDDIQLGYPELIEFWDTVTQPRFVEETCEDHTGKIYDTCPPRNRGGGEGEGEGESAEGVEVQAEWMLGDYTLVALSAEESGDLLQWLDQEGYAVSPALDEVLQDWIDDGQSFLAAKIRPDAPLDAAQTLDPLQIRVRSTEVRLPLRAGTVHSKGTQDVLVYVVTSTEDRGYANITNYPGTTLEDDCLWTADDTTPTFTDFYADWFDAAFAQSDGFFWTSEYSGRLWMEGEPEVPADWPYDYWGDTGLWPHYSHENPWVNRIHLRFTADSVRLDPVVALGPATHQGALVYYTGPDSLRAFRPVCGQGFVDPGDDVCPEQPELDCDNQDDDATKASGCQVAGGAPTGLVSLLLAGFLVVGGGRRSSSTR